jgi:hypothetical protein
MQKNDSMDGNRASQWRRIDIQIKEVEWVKNMKMRAGI